MHHRFHRVISAASFSRGLLKKVQEKKVETTSQESGGANNVSSPKTAINSRATVHARGKTKDEKEEDRALNQKPSDDKLKETALTSATSKSTSPKE